MSSARAKQWRMCPTPWEGGRRGGNGVINFVVAIPSERVLGVEGGVCAHVAHDRSRVAR